MGTSEGGWTGPGKRKMSGTTEDEDSTASTGGWRPRGSVRDREGLLLLFLLTVNDSGMILCLYVT